MNHLKTSNDDFSNALTTDFLLQYILQCHPHKLQYIDLQGSKKGNIDVYRREAQEE